MNARKEIEQRILNEYAKIRANNEQIAKFNLQQAKQNPKFKMIYDEIKDLEFQIAQAVALKQPVTHLKSKLNRNKLTLDLIIESMGYKKSDFKTSYNCSKCKDTGYIKQEQCNCFRTKVNNELIKASGLEIAKLNTFEDFNANIANNENHKEMLNLIKDTLQQYALKFGNRRYLNIVLCGKTGVGKTFALECTASEVLKQGYTANFLTAFQLNEQFLKYHTCFDANKQSYLNLLLEPDLLVIDDLGTEPLLKNVTIEYLYLIISERMLKSKATIISTNLSPTEIMSRYNERVFSRLFDKSKSLLLEIKGEDLRRLKRR